VVLSVHLIFSPALAEDKTWSGGGDGSSWSDGNNWFPTGEPTLSSDTIVTTEDSSLVCDETFKAGSVKLAGRGASQVTVQNFVYGTIQPDSTSSTAILNRSGGIFKLQGSGTVTVKGQYIDSTGTVSDEPSFMFWIE